MPGLEEKGRKDRMKKKKKAKRLPRDRPLYKKTRPAPMRQGETQNISSRVTVHNVPPHKNK